MAANPDDPHYAVGMDDALAGKHPYQFQDAVNQARYDRGYAAGELILIDREYRNRARRSDTFSGWSDGSDAFERFEQRMRAKGLLRGSRANCT